MKELVVPAKIENLDTVIDFVNAELELNNCDMKVQMQIAIAVEEIYVNIAHYAYRPENGDATIRCAVGGQPLKVTIIFLDGGKPYNPLERKDPDITLGADQRDIGGLGIFMVKESMDSVEYEYKDNTNILTIKKLLD